MKMGPSATDPSTVLCKPALGGNVYLYYSLDGGSTWETLKILETFSYREEAFTEVRRFLGCFCRKDNLFVFVAAAVATKILSVPRRVVTRFEAFLSSESRAGRSRYLPL